MGSTPPNSCDPVGRCLDSIRNAASIRRVPGYKPTLPDTGGEPRPNPPNRTPPGGNKPKIPKVERPHRPGQRHPGGGRGGHGGNEGGGGDGGGGGDTYEPSRRPWWEEIGSSQRILTLLPALIQAMRNCQWDFDDLAKAIGKTALIAALGTTAVVQLSRSRAIPALAQMVGRTAVAGTGIGVIILFFTNIGSAHAQGLSPVLKLDGQCRQLVQKYKTARDPLTKLEALAELHLIIFAMQLCIDDGIDNLIFAAGKKYSNEPQKQSDLLNSTVSAVQKYSLSVRNTAEQLSSIHGLACTIMVNANRHLNNDKEGLRVLRTHFQPMFTSFATKTQIWYMRRGPIQSNRQDVQNYLFMSKFPG